MNAAEKIIERLGGQRRLATLLGHKNSTTVQGWAIRGTIPMRRVTQVIETAKAAGVKLKLTDFFEKAA